MLFVFVSRHFCGFVECEAQWTQRVGHIEKERERKKQNGLLLVGDTLW